MACRKNQLLPENEKEILTYGGTEVVEETLSGLVGVPGICLAGDDGDEVGRRGQEQSGHTVFSEAFHDAFQHNY